MMTFCCNRQEILTLQFAVGDPALRQKIAHKLQKNPYIHFSEHYSPRSRGLFGCKTGSGLYHQHGCKSIHQCPDGDFVFLNIGAMVCHDGRLGDYVTLAPDVKLAGVHIGSHCDIGLGTKVIQDQLDCGSRYRCGSRCCAGCGGSRYGCWCTGAKDVINIDFSMSYDRL